MVTVFNAFFSYLVLFVIFACIIVVSFILGMKLRASKDAKENSKAEAIEEEK